MILEAEQHLQRLRNVERLAYLRRLDLMDSPCEDAFDRLTNLASRIFGTPISLVSIVGADRQYFKSFVGLKEPLSVTRQTSLDYSFCQYAVSSQKPLVIDDARKDPVLKDSLAVLELDVIAYAGIPLVTSDGFALGALCVIETKPREWTDEELSILRDLAQAVMTEIELRYEVRERKLAEATLRRQLSLLGNVVDFSATLNESLLVEPVVNAALDTALRLSNAACGFLGLVEDGALRLACSVGPYSEAAINDSLRSGTGIVARVVRERQPELVTDVNADPNYVVLIPETRAKIVLPLVSHGKLMGVLNLETHERDCFDEDNFRYLQLLAAHAASAIDNARLYEQLEHQLQDLQAAHKQLGQLEQLKTDMIRIAAHDLRNPISIITGYASLLNRTCTPATTEEIAPLVEPIVEAADRMNAITSDILSLQRIEALANEQADIIDLAVIVREAFSDLCGEAAAKPVRFELELADISLAVRAESAYLTEAVVNLMNNAIKYTPAGGSVHVSLTCEGERAQFEVTDTGIGVPEDKQARLFQPFSRVHTEETYDIEGTGLGLYLVKQVVERFGGEMRFESTYRKGSTFGFTLPLATEVKHDGVAGGEG